MNLDLLRAGNGKFQELMVDIFGGKLLEFWLVDPSSKAPSLIVNVFPIVSTFAFCLIAFFLTLQTLKKVIQGSSEGNVKIEGLTPYTLLLIFSAIMLNPNQQDNDLPLCQKFIVHAGMFSINAADAIWQQFAQEKMAVPKIAPPDIMATTVSKKTLRNMVCAIAVGESRQRSSSQEKPFHLVLVNETGEKKGYDLSAAFSLDGVTEIEWGNEVCGKTLINDQQLEIDSVSSKNPSWNQHLEKVKKEIEKEKGKAYKTLIDALRPIAEQIHEIGGLALSQMVPEAGGADAENEKHLKAMVEKFNGAISRFEKDIHSIPEKIEKFDKRSNQDVVKQVMQGGWASAGLWFNQLADYELAAKLDVATLKVSSKSPQFCGLNQGKYRSKGCVDKDFATNYIDGVKTLFDNTSIQHETNSSAHSKLESDIVSECTQGKCNIEKAKKSLSREIAELFLSNASDFGKPGKKTDNILNQEEKNPVQVLTSLGKGYVLLAEYFYSLRFVLLEISEASTEWMNSWTGKFSSGMTLGGASLLFGGLKALVGELMKLLHFCSKALAANGFLLGYVLPMWPAMIWFSVVLSYIAVLLEAMMVLPFAIVFTLAPEGSGMKGLGLQRVYSIIFNIACRPALYMLSFVACSVLMQVGFKFFNYCFFFVFDGMDTGNPMYVLAIISLYTMFALTFVVTVFGWMVKLPENGIQALTGGITPTLSAKDSVVATQVRGQGVTKNINDFQDSAKV